MLLRVEGYASTVSASSGGSARSVNVSLNILGGLYLNNEVDIGNIESSGGNIGSNKDAELVLLESLEGDFTLVLSNVTVHDLDVFLDLV
jgi:hypothetical protein